MFCFFNYSFCFLDKPDKEEIGVYVGIMKTLHEGIWQFWSSLPGGEECSSTKLWCPCASRAGLSPGITNPTLFSSLPSLLRGKQTWELSSHRKVWQLGRWGGRKGLCVMRIFITNPCWCCCQAARAVGALWHTRLPEDLGTSELQPYCCFIFRGRRGWNRLTGSNSLHFFLELPSSPGSFSWRCIYYSFRFPLTRNFPSFYLHAP